MGCSTCGSRAAAAASQASPYEITLPNGEKRTVSNKAEERTVRDQYYVRERAEARQKGFRVQR
jgi:hypothetical protein